MFVAWVLLLSAIGMEVAATAALPKTEGFRHPWWTALVLAGYAVVDLPADDGDPGDPGLDRVRRLGRPRHRRHRRRRCVLLGERLDVFKAAAIAD